MNFVVQIDQGVHWTFFVTRSCVALALVISSYNACASTSPSELCTDQELNVNGASKHFYETRFSKREGWNEVNGGLGLTCHLTGLGRWNDEVELGFLENSHRRSTLYGAYGLYYPISGTVSTGVKLIVASGYKSYVQTNGIIGGPMPTIKFRLNKTVTLNFSIAPKANSFIFANLGFRF